MLTKKVLHSFRQKELIEVNQKIEKSYFIYIDFLLKSENYNAGNLIKTYLVNVCFA